MTKPIKIVGLGGSANANGTTLAALDIAMEGARSAGADVVRFDVHELALPMYEYGVEPATVMNMVNHVRSAHGMIWCSPLYHGSISGSFKNAIDWLELMHHDDPPYLTDRVIGLMATSGGEQALQAINTMAFIAHSLRAFVVPLTVPVLHSHQAFDDHGRARTKSMEARLHMIGTEVARAASKLAR